MPDPTQTARRGLLADGEAVAAGAEATGGGLHKASTFAEPTLRGTFRKTFEDFRSSYVLRYTPSAPQSGWHTIDVSVPASKSYSVRARRGYLVEGIRHPRRQAPTRCPAYARDFTAAYQRGAYGPVVEGLRQVKDPLQMLRDFEAAGNPWPANPGGKPCSRSNWRSRRCSRAQPATREAGCECSTRFSRFIRHPLEPDPFERYWYFAALTMLEGAIRPSVTEMFLDRARRAFPTNRASSCPAPSRPIRGHSHASRRSSTRRGRRRLRMARPSPLLRGRHCSARHRCRSAHPAGRFPSPHRTATKRRWRC